MVAKRRSTKERSAGPRGPRGPSGETGAQGPPGQDHAHEIAALAAQMAQVLKDLQTQLKRIAQIQAQLDHLTMGQASEGRNRRSGDPVES